MEIIQNRIRGPLHGIPFTVKDCLKVSQRSTTCGFPGWKRFIADDDARVVSRLVEAGAVLLGKTNLPPFLSSFETQNKLFG